MARGRGRSRSPQADLVMEVTTRGRVIVMMMVVMKVVKRVDGMCADNSWECARQMMGQHDKWTQAGTSQRNEKLHTAVRWKWNDKSVTDKADDFFSSSFFKKCPPHARAASVTLSFIQFSFVIKEVSLSLRCGGWESKGIIILGLTPLRPASVDTLSSTSWPENTPTQQCSYKASTNKQFRMHERKTAPLLNTS